MVDELDKEAIKSDDLDENEEEEVLEVIDPEENDDQTDLKDNVTGVSQEKFDQLQKEKDDLYERMLRVQAEFDNYKKRTQKEKISDRKYQSQELATELLPVLDNFERALDMEETDETKAIIEGISMVYNQFKEALTSQGVEVIETVGKQFDPNLHHAVMQVEDGEVNSNVITEELQKGYMLKDRVIRAAMVKVNK